MELTKDIIFDENLIQNQTCNIKYSGKLFKENSEEVFIVYGFDKEWKQTTEQKMEKTDDGFSATIEIKEFDTFNFCFKNSLNVWDNNNYSDYTLPIEKEEISEVNQQLNDLLDTILNEVKSPAKIDVTETEDYKNTVAYFENLFDELFADYEVEAQTISNIDLEQTFPEQFSIESNEEPDFIQEAEIEAAKQELEEITSSPSLALTTTTKRKSIFAFENLSPLYVLKKRIRLALYKLVYVLPAFLFAEEDDNEN